ncbi:MAG: hypothetical protein ACXVZO_04590 [Gaiellaceae bacterium]
MNLFARGLMAACVGAITACLIAIAFSTSYEASTLGGGRRLHESAILIATGVFAAFCSIAGVGSGPKS